MQSHSHTTLNQLDDETAELDYLQDQLGRMDGLTDKLIGILDGFDSRLMKLETSMMPIHRATQNLTKLANNIEDTLGVTETIVNCLNLPSKEEGVILKGPDEDNVLPYLKSMSSLKDAVDLLERDKLKSCEKAANQMKQLLKAGVLQLEGLFRRWLMAATTPVDTTSCTVENNDPASLAMVTRLSELSTHMATFERGTGCTVDFTNTYIDIRSSYLANALHPLSQSVQLSERHQGISYEKGSSGFLKYMECFARMIQAERRFAEKVLQTPKQQLEALEGSIAPAAKEFVATGRHISVVAKRFNYYDTVFVFDILEKYEKDCFRVLNSVGQGVDLGPCFDMMSAFKITALRSFYDFMEDVKGKKDNGAYMNISSDGTVHEMTSNALNFIKKLCTWREVVEPLLTLLGDGGWNQPITLSRIPDQRDSFGESDTGRALLKMFFVDALDQLTISLQTKSRGYKKPTLATIFLLNNYNHVLRQIRSPPLNTILDETTEIKFAKQVKKQLDAYQESWKPCVENLMDVTYVRGGAIKNMLDHNDRQLIKDRFKNFNTEFEEICRAQTTYAIPDNELRNQVIRDVKNVLVPMYGRFAEKYQGTDFTKNPGKYIRYDKEKLDSALSHLFEPSA